MMAQHKSKRVERPESGARELPPYLKRLGIKPRKSLGQNFLIDELALGDIAEATRVPGVETVLEIGAGPGGLTEELVERFKTVVAIEIDEELAELTRQRLGGGGGLTVIAADILEFNARDLLTEAGTGPPYVVAGNLPYYITQPIVRKLLESDPAPARTVVMVQRQVARRMVGGNGRESLLSMSIKFYGTPRALFDVPASAFWPQPKVDSAVVAIDRLAEPPVPISPEQRDSFFELLRAGYASPRKQLHNVLPGVLGLSSAAVGKTLEAAGLEPALRAQHLNLSDWAMLFGTLNERHPGVLTLREPS
jgi:16S rRNA (adenine1518-N6/adenine1519-N6)-dimethyltransferase